MSVFPTKTLSNLVDSKKAILSESAQEDACEFRAIDDMLAGTDTMIATPRR